MWPASSGPAPAQCSSSIFSFSPHEGSAPATRDSFLFLCGIKVFFPLSGLESHYLPSLEWPSDALPWTKPWPFFTVARADVYFVTFFWGVSSFACYSAGDAQIRWGRVRSSSTWQLKPLIQLCHFLTVWLWVRSSLDSATVSSSVNRDENTAHVLRFLKEIVLVKCLAQCLACRKCSINT